MKHKRKILLTIVIIFIAILTINVQTKADYISITEFEKGLKSQGKYTITVTKKDGSVYNYNANYNIYKETKYSATGADHIIVYGGPNDITSNDYTDQGAQAYDSKGNPKYLGYTSNGNIQTNPLYFTGSSKRSVPWDRLDNTYFDTWSNMLRPANATVFNYMKNSIATNNEGGFKTTCVLSDVGLESAEFLAAPTTISSGSFRVTWDTTWMTFITPPLPSITRYVETVYTDTTTGKQILRDPAIKREYEDPNQDWPLFQDNKTFDGYKYIGYKLSYDGANTFTTLNPSAKVSNVIAKSQNRIYIHFLYEKLVSTVTVKYINADTGSEISTAFVDDNVTAGSHTYTAKSINGFTYQPGAGQTATGQTINVVLGTNYTITFKYKKVASVTVKHVDYDTNSDLQVPQDYYSPVTPGSQTYNIKSFVGYTFQPGTGQTASGQTINVVAGTDYSIIFKYKKNAGTVTIEYKDADTNLVIDTPTVYTNVTAGSKTYTAKGIAGYTYQPGAGQTATGQTINVLSGQNYTVTFKYKRNSGVTIRYIDFYTYTDIDTPTNITNVTPGSQTYNAKVIPGYAVQGDPTKTIDIVAGQSYTVIFTYKSTKTMTAPTVTLYAPSRVVLGDTAYISAVGNSADPNVASLSGNISFQESGVSDIIGAETQGNSITFGEGVVFSSVGTYHAQATVLDNNGLSGISNVVTIEVVNPTPVVILNKSGTQKENRKLSIDASNSSGGSRSATIDWTKAKWIITPISGGSASDVRVQKHTEGATNGEILIDSSRGIDKGLTGDLKQIDILFKKSGEYKIELSLTNNYNISNSNDITLFIRVDEAPTASIYATKSVYRDPNDKSVNGKSQATIEASDSSSSLDGDIIVKRAYVFAFDTNNDKNYDEEMAYVYDLSYNGVNQIPKESASNPHLRPLNVKVKDLRTVDFSAYNTGNMTKCTIKTTNVGRMIVGIAIQEEFGQETIPQFITPSDKKRDDNFDD